MSFKSSIRAALPRRSKPRRILAGPLRGRRLVTSWHDYPGALLGRTEGPLLEWFAARVRPGDTWLDVGAHYGYTAMALCDLVGPQGRVFAFEPMLKTAGDLAETRRVNGLHQLRIVPLALGDRAQGFPVTVSRGMAAIDRGTIATPELVYSVALDSSWAWLAGYDRRIDGIKIDVQGMEAEALIGMEGTLTNVRPYLVVEFHQGVDRAPILELLARAGYGLPGNLIDERGVSGPTEYRDDRSYAFDPPR